MNLLVSSLIMMAKATEMTSPRRIQRRLYPRVFRTMTSVSGDLRNSKFFRPTNSLRTILFQKVFGRKAR